MTTINFEYNADTSGLRAELAKIPGVTKKTANDASKVWSKTFAVTQRASVKAAKASEKAWRHANKQTTRAASSTKSIIPALEAGIGQWKKFGETAQGSVGAVVGRVGTLAEFLLGFGKMGPVGIAVGGLVVTLGGVAVAAGAAVAAWASGVAVLTKLVFKAEAWLDAAEKAGKKPIIPPEQVEAIRTVNAALGVLGNVMRDIGLTIAGNVAPEIRELSIAVVALSLYVHETVKTFLDGRSALREFSVFIVETVVRTLNFIPTVLTESLRAFQALMDGIEAFSPIKNPAWAAISKGIDAWVESNYRFTRSIAEGVVDLVPFESGLDRVASSMDGYMARAREMVEVEEKRRAALRATTTALHEQADATALLVAPSLEGAASTDRISEAFERLAASKKKEGEQDEEAKKRRAEFLKTAGQIADALEVSAFWTGQVTNLTGALSEALRTRADNAEEGSERQKRAEMAAFRIDQAAGITNVIVSTAQAIARQYADLPFPVAVASSALVGAMGAAQVATIAGASPPSFHQGGQIGRSGPNAPDEVLIRARAGEQILTRGDQQQAAAPMMILTEQRYRHRSFGAFVADATRQKSSPLRAAVKARSGRVGHRGRR